ncbi:MAG: redoxin domain-containing protein [Candidatus Latescibacteria bacterium]|nr:redoxin domain-containing protein [Candidatus Latescibacterota bacterium]
MQEIRKISLILNILLSVLLLVALFGIWKLRNTNSGHWKEIRELRKVNADYKEHINTSTYASNYQGQEFPKLQLKNTNGDWISTDFSQTGKGLVLVFKAQDCQPCLITQIKLLAHVYQNQNPSKRFPIYAFANAPSEVLKKYKKSFNLHYELLPDTEDMLFQNKVLTHRTPAIFVVNKKNIITHCHLPSKDRPQNSVLFFGVIQKHLPLQKPLLNNHLKGLTYSRIIAENFDTAPLSTFIY